MRLQSHDHRSSGYERPDEWICGHAEDGHPCRLGPDASGKCRTTHECTPARSGDRWRCTRPEAFGGPCEGPLPDGTCSRPVAPCAPVPKRLKRERVTSRWMLLVALGVLLLLVGGWSRQTWISPGPLSHAHAEIESCQECHEGFREGPGGWIALAFGEIGDPSRKCVGCHYRAEHPFFPHSADPEMLARLTAQKDEERGPIVLALAGMLTDEDSQVRCTACHEEHRGRSAKLTEVRDGMCQSCHAARFASFSKGHPELGRYPYERRTHLIFDHRAHLGKHFDEEGRRAVAPAGCVGCHQVEPSGEKMLVLPFAETCARCHEGQVGGEDRPSGTRAIEVLTAPGLDLWTLEQKGYDVGSWPRLSERPITPFMKLILGADPEMARDLAAVENADLLDLEDADRKTVESAVRLARAIKQLYWELETEGPDRLAQKLDPEGRLRREDLSALLASLPRAVVRNANREWFPDLEADVRRFRGGAPLRSPVPSAESRPSMVVEVSGFRENEDLLAAEDDLLAGGADDLLSGAEDDLLAGGNDDLLSGGDDDLLAGGGDDLLSGGVDLLGGETSSEEEEPEEEIEPMDAEEWAKLGGWFLDLEALLYRPVGHPDSFLHAWLSIAPTLEERAGSELFRKLTENKPPGACTKCHSVDRSARGVTVNWLATDLTETTRGFTGFAHAPHFSLMGNRGCVSCHRLDERADYLATYESDDPGAFDPGWEPVGIALCERCHNGRGSSQGCTLCHNYHVGISRRPPRL